MSREPAEDVGFISALRKDVPQRFDFSRSAGDRPDAAGLCVRLHEAENAVLVRPLAGGDGIPQHGRKNGPQRGKISNDPVVDEIVQRGHQPLVEKGIDNLPVGCIPADEQNFLRECGHGKSDVGWISLGGNSLLQRRRQ